MRKGVIGKVSVSLCAAAMALSALSISASAADWQQVTYADGDPNNANIIATDANSVTFTNSASGIDLCKVSITLDKILKNPDDYSKIAEISWRVTYKGVTPSFSGEALSGGTYITNANSAGYSISCDGYDENNKPVWEKTEYSATNIYKVPADMPLIKDGEIVFMDWSAGNIGGQGITVTVSDLTIKDKSGNAIAQMSYGETAPDIPPAVTASEPELVVEEEPEVPPAVTAAPVVSVEPVDDEEEYYYNDDIYTAPKTGDTGAYVAAGSIAAAALMLAVTHKKKEDK